LEAVISGLDTGLGASYMIVQHLPKGFTGSLARRLGRLAPIPVVEAEDGMPVERDTAYIAPHGSHMTVAGRRTMRMSLQDAPPLHGVRPAADPLFMSVAEHIGKDSVGVVLTGMGSDGAAGLRSIMEAGGTTIVQDEDSSVVWGMPGAAVRMGVASRVVPIDDVASEIRRAVRG
jgi:two-component system chemotaxis response regulator CheB